MFLLLFDNLINMWLAYTLAVQYTYACIPSEGSSITQKMQFWFMVPRWHRRSKPGLWDRHATILGTTSEDTCFGLWNMILKFQSQGIFVHLWYYDSLKCLRTSCAPRFVGKGWGNGLQTTPEVRTDRPTELRIIRLRLYVRHMLPNDTQVYRQYSLCTYAFGHTINFTEFWACTQSALHQRTRLPWIC